MIPALEKAGRVLKGMKQIGRIYGVDVDASLAAGAGAGEGRPG